MTKIAGRRVVVLGALSAIGEATARLYAAEGGQIVVVGRNPERLDSVAADLRVRGAMACHPWPLDLATTAEPARELEAMTAVLGGSVDVILIFYGVLGDQRQAEQATAEARRVLDVNFTSAVEWCLAAANVLERQRQGALLAVSSVAGDRGRQSNYVYGAAKAGLTILVEGIAHRLAPSGARAMVVKLGFVDTPMTAHIAKKGALWAKPGAVAQRIKDLADRGKKPIVYVPAFWRLIMFVVRNLPTPIFHKTKL